MAIKRKPNIQKAGITVLVPAYNEGRYIGSVVLQAMHYADRVIVVDDGSSDATGQIARDAGAIVISHSMNLGKAASLNTGFSFIKSHPKPNQNTSSVVVLDADGQHMCEDIPIFAAQINSGEADIVVGSRFLEKKSRIPRWRIFGQRALTLATNIGSGINLTDSQSGFRAFSMRAIEKIDFGSEGFSAESEIQFLAKKYDFRVREVPIEADYSEPMKRSPIKQGMSVVGGIVKLIGQYRPLFYFSVPGMFSLLFGIGWGFAVIDRFINHGELAVGFTLICLLLSILGMILLSTGVILHSVRGLLIDLWKRR